MAARRSRSYFIFAVAALVIAAVAAAFWPQPILVDLTEVRRGPMQVTIDEDARTRVHDPFIVSTPITGRLMRVEVEPGDPVIAGETVLARMLPTNPQALDIRTREQARGAVTAAEAALRVAEADLNRARADADLARIDLDRARRLAESGTVSQVALERAEQIARTADATLDTAEAALAIREAELSNARAQLIDFDSGDPAGREVEDDAIVLTAPADGRVLQVMQQSETTLPVGTPILEFGNIEEDLEVVVALLSTDAVAVDVGDPVIIDNWGGEPPLSGRVAAIDPLGYSAVSALGVEEQRVNARIDLLDPPDARTGLGHGYRVEARIVVWEEEDVLIVPASALFRNGEGDWAVFRSVDGLAQEVPVDILRNNGLEAAVGAGVDEGDVIVLYPPAGLASGQAVADRAGR